MKKILLTASLAFSMSACAQENVTIKGHYGLKMYQFSNEYINYNNLGECSDFPRAKFYWGPKYFMYNQDTVVLTYAFKDNEIYNDVLYLQEGNYKVEKIANKLWMLVK